MRKITKEDIYCAMDQMETFIDGMDSDEFDIFIIGKTVMTALLPPSFELYGDVPGDIERRLMRLELRIS